MEGANHEKDENMLPLLAELCKKSNTGDLDARFAIEFTETEFFRGGMFVKKKRQAVEPSAVSSEEFHAAF